MSEEKGHGRHIVLCRHPTWDGCISFRWGEWHSCRAKHVGLFFTFLQTVDTFKFVHMLCVCMWPDFITSGRGGGDGGVVITMAARRPHTEDSVLTFVSVKPMDHFLGGNWEIFQTCYWQQNPIFANEMSGQFPLKFRATKLNVYSETLGHFFSRVWGNKTKYLWWDIWTFLSPDCDDRTR